MSAEKQAAKEAADQLAAAKQAAKQAAKEAADQLAAAKQAAKQAAKEVADQLAATKRAEKQAAKEVANQLAETNRAEKQAAKEVANQLAATKRAEKQAELETMQLSEALTERVAFNRAERAEKQAAKLAADKLEIENNLAERDSIKRDEEIERVAAAKEAADKLAAGTNCTERASSSKNEQQWDDMFEVLVRYIEEIREMATRHMSEEQKAAWFWDGNVPQSYKTPCGKTLGVWITNQRSAKAKDTLITDRGVRLTSTGLRWRMKN
jgi:hypothetical protein